jgi:Mannose-6-phosphate isomerase
MIVDRPWGRVSTYALNQPVTVRVVTVDPGATTGAHYHRLREEMWIVLDPGLTLEIGNRTVVARGPNRAGSSRSRSDTPARTTAFSWTGRTMTMSGSGAGRRAPAAGHILLARHHAWWSPCTGEVAGARSS